MRRVENRRKSMRINQDRCGRAQRVKKNAPKHLKIMQNIKTTKNKQKNRRAFAQGVSDHQL